MATHPLCVLALDGADRELLERWNCDQILLSNSARIETFAWSGEYPYTPEVWTTVATGVMPDEHGVSGEIWEWENPVLNQVSKLTSHLPMRWRKILGRPFKRRGSEFAIPKTVHEHLFEPGAVKGWPGVAEADNMTEAWIWCELSEAGYMTDRELEQKLFGNFGEELGWLLANATLDVPVAGVHSHILDIYGHLYCKREAKLRDVYTRVNSLVGRLRKHVPRLLLISDHGMQVSWLGDEEPGMHSWRAVVTSTEVGPLPKKMIGVRPWIEARIGGMDDDVEADTVTSDTTRAQLEALGYIT